MIRHSSFQGVLALVGGGEFSFGETAEADQAWLDETPEGSTIGFVPAASGSEDYGRHFAEYLAEEFERAAETIPIYRGRDGRRGKNSERIREVGAVYLGGGVADHLLEALAGTVAAEALAEKLRSGGVVVAIAASAQAVGAYVRSISGGASIPGLGWLPGGVVEPNFDPGHDRRLRKLLEAPGVAWGLGIPSGAAVIFGPEGIEVVGTAYLVRGAKGTIETLS